jgi:NTE family protein
MRLGVNLEIADQGANFDLRLGYQRTMLNRLGGEVLITGQIGSRNGLGIDFYQPLDPAQTFFVEPIAAIDRRLAPIYQNDQKIAEYRIRTSRVEFGAGVNVARLGQIRAGWLDKRLWGWLETGLPFFPTGQSKYDGPFVGLDFDQMNRLYFPTQGWSTRLRYFSTSGPDEDFSRLDARAEGVVSIGRHVLGGVASYTGSPRGRLPFFDAATLGGFKNLSAFAPGQLVGDDTTYAQARLERIIGVLPIGLRGDIRVGLMLEAARRGVAYSETQLTGWLNSASLYLGGETPLGPVYLGYSYSTSGNWNVYLFLGTP